MADGLFTFGTLETVEIPSTGPGYANDATAKAPLGVLLRYNGNVYRYVQHYPGTAVATALGYVAYWKTLAPASGSFIVSSDETDSLMGINGVAGIYGCVVASQYYTWIQVGGVATALVKAHALIGSQCLGYATDITLDFVAVNANTTGVVFGIVTVANQVATNSNASVLLQNLIW